ncbi:hypothetical protein Syun_020640 [Stephania yunnanensis]|uniref:Uncharacterized protein n=1 Tax=Stephania yunnanensis TaxID=152371 RepID=A0AAP0NP29_9MAGN
MVSLILLRTEEEMISKLWGAQGQRLTNATSSSLSFALHFDSTTKTELPRNRELHQLRPPGSAAQSPTDSPESRGLSLSSGRFFNCSITGRSYSSFLGLASGELLDLPVTPKAVPRLMNYPGVISDLKSDKSNDGGSDTPPIRRERKIIVANMLPLHAQRDAETGSWKFSLDEDSLLVQLKDGLSSETEVLYVGSLKVDVESHEQEEVSQKLFEEFGCVPTFLPPDLHKKFYHGFCKQQLWPLFHYMLPISPDHGDRFDRSLWHSYVSANKIFADRIMEKRFTRVKLGFFLHSPFPSSEIYRTLPVRDEILKALLNCDLIGFHTFDYARHFLSCCSRMLGLDYECKRGYIGLEYFGRTIYIKILPVGIHLGRLESILNLPSTINKAREIQEQYKGKKLFLGVDDMDIFKGISLKLLAVENLLKQNPDMQGKLVLIQIVNPARSTGKGKVAYYAMAECCIVNAVRDGMNLVPYEYVVCRQGTKAMDEARGKNGEYPHLSMLVVSEFIGCSPSLSGAIRINPWDIDAVADALNSALNIHNAEKQLRHEKHYKYVSTHDVGYWGRSFIQDLERACKEHYSKRCWGIGFGLGFRVIALSPNFRKLSISHIISSYNKTSRRAIFLDYDGTIIPQCSIMKAPSPEVISVLSDLCNDPKNTVFIVSGRGRNSLSEWFDPCEKLGLAAEHGYFIRAASNPKPRPNPNIQFSFDSYAGEDLIFNNISKNSFREFLRFSIDGLVPCLWLLTCSSISLRNGDWKPHAFPLVDLLDLSPGSARLQLAFQASIYLRIVLV